MSAAEWVGFLAGLIAIATGFLAALRWMVRQFVQEIGNQLSVRMDRLEIEIGVLTNRQSEIYATIIRGGSNGTKANKRSKSRNATGKRTRRQKD